MKFRVNKRFNNKRIGKFRSLFEKQISDSLPKKKGIKISYESHSISYSIPRVYNPDFTITYPSGRVVHIEVKGYFRTEDRQKMKYVIQCNPTLDIRMIFPRKNKRDIKWCEKQNVPYAIGKLPMEWLNE